MKYEERVSLAKKHMRRCHKCKKTLHFNKFYKRRIDTDIKVPFYQCILCVLKHAREYRKTKTGKIHYKKQARKYLLKKSFGMSLNEYNKKLKKQNGLCGLCGEKETHTISGILVSLSVDHNHNTGQIRDLLCFRCNSHLITGLENRNALLLTKKAVKYIKKWNIK